MPRLRPLALLLPFFVAVSPAAAQPGATDKARAEALFDRAMALTKEGKMAEACPKLAESQRLDPAVGTLLYLADCYESTGRLASAWATFREALALARSVGQPAREKIARDRAAALEAKVPKLTVALAPGADAPGLEVRLDDEPFAKAVLGEPTPLDPGEHTVAAKAPGKRPWTTKVKLTAGSASTVTVPALETEISVGPPASASVAPPAASSAAPPAASSAPVAPPPSPRPAVDEGKTTRTLGLVVAGAGAVSLLAGGYFGQRAFSKWSEAQDHCVGDRCDEQAAKASRDSRSAGNVSTILVGLGIVGLGAGATLYLTAPKPQEGRVGVTPLVAQGGGGLFVTVSR